MARIVNIREIPLGWPTSGAPCKVYPGFAIDHGGVLEFVPKEVADKRAAQKSVRGSTADPDAIDRSTLKSYRLGWGTTPPTGIDLSEFMS